MDGPAMGIIPRTSVPTKESLEPSWDLELAASGLGDPTNDEPHRAETEKGSKIFQSS